jgi:hypothetical protein
MEVLQTSALPLGDGAGWDLRTELGPAAFYARLRQRDGRVEPMDIECDRPWRAIWSTPATPGLLRTAFAMRAPANNLRVNRERRLAYQP